jgi:PIN domain nuclease of toxin-antitoxin system
VRLLLDTHVLLWSALEPQRLSAPIASELDSPTNELWLSPITTWECMVLADKGRIALGPDASTWLRKVIAEVGFIEAPLNHEVAIKSRQLTLSHDDPADRFLAATAAVYDLTLVTMDKHLLAGKGYALLSTQ